ncbi:MAG: preprotein translocase subunit SecY [Bacilli bacterium]|nr:preprotein translocase subunit SecY [Bacilli bacterium]
MFSNLKLIFSPKNKDIRKRILYTLFCLLIFIVGTTIPVPGVDSLKNIDFGDLANAITGGSLRRFSIFALGVMPYISATIITSLLQMDILPYFTELKESGAQGRQKINQINRFLGIGIAFIEGFGMSFALVQNATAIDYVKITIILTAGTAFLLWMGDRITQKGIGNGISLLIMAGILATIPGSFVDTFKALVMDNSSLFLGIIEYILFILIYIIIIVAVVFVQESERRIPIQYSNQTTSSYGAKQNYIPFKLNSANVMPVIFASVIFTVPTFIAGLIKSENGFVTFIKKYANYTTPSGFIVYVILIFAFSFFYTFIQVNPEELSKNLSRQGGYIPGVRPGKETIKYIKTVLGRITLIGALFISLIAGLPIVVSSFLNTNLPTSVSIGGTSILIIVGVALETVRQLESSLINRNYGRRGR